MRFQVNINLLYDVVRPPDTSQWPQHISLRVSWCGVLTWADVWQEWVSCMPALHLSSSFCAEHPAIPPLPMRKAIHSTLA
jgi:hypothetical protein